MSAPVYWKNRVMAKCNTIAKVIREKSPITFAQLCLAVHIAPSTLYAYIPMILEIFPDIEYENKTFRVKGD